MGTGSLAFLQPKDNDDNDDNDDDDENNNDFLAMS
jgi:hypothetical protein